MCTRVLRVPLTMELGCAQLDAQPVQGSGGSHSAMKGQVGTMDCAALGNWGNSDHTAQAWSVNVALFVVLWMSDGTIKKELGWDLTAVWWHTFVADASSFRTFFSHKLKTAVSWSVDPQKTGISDQSSVCCVTFTDSNCAVSHDASSPLTGQLACLPQPQSGVYLTGCDTVIYVGIKTELAHIVSPHV